MKHVLRLSAIVLALLFLFTACNMGGTALAQVRVGGDVPDVDSDDRGPHFAAPLTRDSEPVASSGWLELFLDQDSMTAQVRGFDEAEWFTLPQIPNTPRANQGAAAVTLDIIVNGQRITLNSQDHSVYWNNATSQVIEDGVQVNYLITPNRETAQRDDLTQSCVAFTVFVRYIVRDGNFIVEADWENTSDNPNAFIETMGLMERFGTLRNPGEDDFLLLPDGGGALLFPARANHEQGFATTADLHFAVYGEDPTNPVVGEHSESLININHRDEVLGANVAAFGARYRNTAFTAVVARGAAMATIVAQQNIPGEQNVRQSAVGTRFTITPTRLDGNTLHRATESFGNINIDGDEEFPLRISYRFFFGTSSAEFSSMATSIREQLINAGILSSTKTVRNPDWPLPLHLTLIGTQQQGLRRQTLTTFDQGLDIATRLKNRGVDNMNLRFIGAITENPERTRPLRRLGGNSDLAILQNYCQAQSFTLFLDATVLQGRGAVDITGSALPLRTTDGVTQSVRSRINRLSDLTGGISISDAGNTLHADHRMGHNRQEVAGHLVDILPALATQQQMMIDHGHFHTIRTADVIVNLPLSPQLRTSPRSDQTPRYQCVPLLAMILSGIVDYSGISLNLAHNPGEEPLIRSDMFLRSIAYGAVPAFTWTATAQNSDDPLYFEAHLEAAVEIYEANATLADLRRERIVSYHYDTDARVSITQFSNGTIIYVNFSNRVVTVNDIQISARNFVRVGNQHEQ